MFVHAERCAISTITLFVLSDFKQTHQKSSIDYQNRLESFVQRCNENETPEVTNTHCNKMYCTVLLN